MKLGLFALVLLIDGCAGVKGCPAQTAVVTLQCKQAVLKGEKTKEDCYSEIEKSCP